LATLVERILVVFLPIAILIYPFFKFLPQISDWLMQTKITRLYDEMRSIESEINVQAPIENITALNTKLDELEDRANSLRLPNNYTSMLYTLRSHLNLVRVRLAARTNKSPFDR
jgi:hypothetical protein